MNLPASTPEFRLGSTIVRYPLDSRTGLPGFELFPARKRKQLVARRSSLRGESYIGGEGEWPAVAPTSLVQVKLRSDAYSGGFAHGQTMRDAASNRRFRLESQRVQEETHGRVIETTLQSSDGLRLEHRLRWRKGEIAFRVTTLLHNGSGVPVTVEMLSSFVLSGITPFHVADAPGRLFVHRFRSRWSAEGRHDCVAVEALHLERSWSGSGAFCERFGQVGTMPVRGWFPFVALEDRKAGVFWGVQLAWAGSWQIEVFRKGDDLSLSGGLADREFGHWKKVLAPGESLQGPEAIVAAVAGSIDDCCEALTQAQVEAVGKQPESERELPVVFNEWATTWGDPQHDKVVAIADRLQGSGVRYLVVDAGWYRREGTPWYRSHGDWHPNANLFPQGLKATADAIRARGLIPGLWFEMETVGILSDAFERMSKHQLTLDGLPLTVGERRFWNLNDPVAIDYLERHVIDLLEECGFGYLKVDYNEAIGIGVDHPDSVGEGLRQQVEGIYRFFERIRARLPDLVIENCSSGGHRLEASMLSRTAMSSFSDAHELPEIPIIAANLHRLILPRQSQIWAVLRRGDAMQRLRYSLAAGFLGRLCLSGDVSDLSNEAWEAVRHAINLYAASAPLIRDGKSRYFGKIGSSWRHPEGWQGVRRMDLSGASALVVLHAFQNAPAAMRVPLPKGTWRVRGSLAGKGVSLQENTILWQPGADFSGEVLLLAAESSHPLL